MAQRELRNVEKVGVLGAGTMGSGIAQIAAEAGLEVLVHDPIPGAYERARDRISGFLRSGHPDIRLLLADVDGTLVTQDKVLTEAAKEAARELHDAGIALAITSGRPPRGMSMLIKPLTLRGAIAGFNGGVFVNPDAP